jgi:hypothetical protein
VGGALALVLAAEIIAAVYVITAGPDSKPYEAWHGLAAVVSLIAIAVAGWLVTLLRQDYSDPAKRKTIGRCGTWAPSGPGRSTRSPRPATPNVPYPRWWTASAC